MGRTRCGFHPVRAARDDATLTSGTVVFRVEDLETARWTLEERGAVFDEHVGEVARYARFATFRDPDGNAVQIIEYTPAP
jgi:predicted enzyme related to lactoylglutathione lyase